jgi:hypothetical protein
LLVLLALQMLAAAAAFAQEPATRAEALAREREAKSKQLAPPQPSRTERVLMALENDRIFERILNPAEGLYPKITNITAGGGFAVGPAYRRPGLLGERAIFSAFAVGSVKKYWLIDARLVLPELASVHLFADVHGRVFEYPREDFFGLGPESRRENDVIYGFRSSQVGAAGGLRPVPWFALGAGVDYLTPSIGSGDGGRPISQLFNAGETPGLDVQPDFLRYELSADFNSREPRGNPRRGGQYKLVYQRLADRDLSRFSLNRVEVDLQQYVPLLRDRRVLAFRALASTSDADAGQQVPFYFQRTLGGPDDLRGFRQFRFRDRNLLLLQAEYRWEIFTAVDGAIFYDAGNVASRLEDLSLRDLESDYGIGFRFGTRSGVFLRVEGAFGSRGGKHFIFRFGHVF